ncbi:MAG: hypothetical protein HOP10_03110 [Chitinophagaceae bacterium]|nr:hypothetical protein [Chitinophagaceae bacterium]
MTEKKPVLNLLLIDDNPEYAFCDKTMVPSLPSEVMEDNTLKELPWVSRSGQSKTIAIFNRLMGVEQHFRLKWLQFHQDVYEYRNLSFKVRLEHGLKKLSEVGFIPDLIIFDYALTDNRAFHPSMYHNYLNNPRINSYLNPTISLAEFLKSKGETIVLPRNEGYVDHSEKLPSHYVNDDSYGLYCGCLVAEMYKHDLPIAAIPVTRKDVERIANEPDAAFFEYLINNTYHNTFTRRHRSRKDWNNILSDGLPIYRTEIVHHLRNKKISLDFDNLLSLLNGHFLKNSVSPCNYLSLYTIYGKKDIPLAGLFIDENIIITTEVPADLKKIAGTSPVTERDVATWDFVNRIAKTILLHAGKDLDTAIIGKTKSIGDTLWKCYAENFEKRMDLSEYYSREGNLTETEQEAYEELKSFFSIEPGEGIPENAEISILNYAGWKPEVLRLSIFYTIAKAAIRYNRAISIDRNSAAYEELQEQDIYYLLNPLVNTTKENKLLLPMNMETYADIRKVLDVFGRQVVRYLKDTNPTPKANKSFYDFSTWISSGEKHVIRQFFTEDEIFFPYWLKQ